MKVPENVVTEEYQNEFVSLLYTLLDGVYYKDDDDNLISITSIGSIPVSYTHLDVYKRQP